MEHSYEFGIKIRDLADDYDCCDNIVKYTVQLILHLRLDSSRIIRT